MEHLRTIKTPPQPIPTFAETVTLLMKVCHLITLSTVAYISSDFISPRTYMSNLTLTSRSTMTLRSCSNS